ncbi:MAG: hypothetical protein IPM38_16925 [Ignavibacteria bacterium]|nr:hypothetical protein [Ignavibacteria bacterium]
MKIISESFITEKTAKYYLRPAESGNARTVWILLHGYAQLAGEFLPEFDFINNNDHMLIAPEGLSRFYFRNKIGASWMTKEDRENEISDYVNYLNKLTDKIKSEYYIGKSEFNLLGFSQGVHTAVRFFINGNHFFNNLILCSSDFPKDADFSLLREKLSDSKLYYIHGTSDPVISESTYSGSAELLKKNNINFRRIKFDGGHVVNKETLSYLFLK